MNDSLRTRIAAALLGDHCIQGMTQPCDDCREHALRQADAVITELGLEPQVHYDPDCEFYRYVTDWIDPQNNQRVDLP